MKDKKVVDLIEYMIEIYESEAMTNEGYMADYNLIHIIKEIIEISRKEEK